MNKAETIGFNEAAVLKAIKGAPTDNGSDTDGVRIRVVNELVNTYAISVAREADRGSDPSDVAYGITRALGQIAACTAITFGNDPARMLDVILEGVTESGRMTLRGDDMRRVIVNVRVAGRG